MKNYSLIIFSVFIFLSSCVDKEKTLDNGVNIKYLKRGDGQKINEGEIVMLNLKYFDYDGNELLNKVSNPKVRGFSVNSCNYRSTEESMVWAKKICRYRKTDRFVIDTSRNGQGPLDEEWCNPVGRGLGEFPSTITKHRLCDAYLWIKIPGESDGKCNGGPKAVSYTHLTLPTKA